MKIGKHIFLIVLSYILSPILFVSFYVSVLNVMPVSAFRNADNYEKLTGTVTWVSDDRSCLTARADNWQDSPYYEGESFRIYDCNRALMSPDELRGLSVGDRVEIDSQPGIFGDGWDYPVTGLTVNGRELMSPDEGRAALVGYYKEHNRSAIFILVLFLLLSVGNVLLCVFAIRGLVRTVRRRRAARDLRPSPRRFQAAATEVSPNPPREPTPEAERPPQEESREQIAVAIDGKRAEVIGPQLLRDERRPPDDRAQEDEDRPDKLTHNRKAASRSAPSSRRR